MFGYFIIYLKVTPNEQINFYGMRVKKWVVPFIQLVVLSFLLQASFIGHLSGIAMGFIYISGCPGCFAQRQKIIKKIENYRFLEFITNRGDFCVAPQQPVISVINWKPCLPSLSSLTSSGTTSAAYSRVSTEDYDNMDHGLGKDKDNMHKSTYQSSGVEMTCTNGI